MYQGCRSFIPTANAWIKALGENNGNREDTAKNYFDALLKKMVKSSSFYSLSYFL
jgi:hypothetical protein